MTAVITPQDLLRIKPLGGGWYEYEGEKIGYSDIEKRFTPWVESQGGIYVTTYNYGMTAIAVGKNPTIPDNAVIHDTVVVHEKDLGFLYYLTAVIRPLLKKDLIEYAGYGEDSNDDVDDNAMTWL